MTSILDQLRGMTTIVADTGDLAAVARLKPIDCTTNPTIVLKSRDLPEFVPVRDATLDWGRQQSGPKDGVIAATADRLAIGLGAELAARVSGRVSTEVDADLSFDTNATVAKAREIIAAYDGLGIDRSRILIKIAATWEGIRAAEILQKDGIDTNITLLFCRAQAIAAADAGAFLISPFVGRILDWHKAKTGTDYTAETDPGVLSVRSIYDYYKHHGIDTVVMGASFRNTGEIKALAGCDRLTIAPNLLDELASETGDLPRALSPDQVEAPARIEMNEAAFRWALNEDAMATEKLAEGIRAFAADLGKLRLWVAEQLDA